MRDWRFGALLGLFVLVIGLHLATPALDSDQAVTGLMGVHVLRGELPVFFWNQDHAGVPESYVAAVSFFLLGVSRLSLNIVPALTALGLLLVVYRTATVLFGHGAGLLAMLFATIVSPYVSWHYVLARAYYIEYLLLGQIVLLGAALWLRRVGTPSPVGASRADEPPQARLLVAMGLAGGVGLYCGFQIAYALGPAALALLLVDPGLPFRRAAWLGLGAFLFGSAPFWAYNLGHDWATFATGARFQGGESAGEAGGLLLLRLVPQILGVTGGAGTPPYLPWPFSLAAPLLAGLAVVVLAARAAHGARHLRRDPTRAGEALLVVTVAVTVGMVWHGRFVQVARYLLPLSPVLAIILARACQLAWRRAPVVAVLGAAVYLVAVGAGLVRELNVLAPTRWAAYWAARTEDETLFAFLRIQGLDRAYAYDYWVAPRLTFDARETIIVADPFQDRYPPYSRAVDASPRPAYLITGNPVLFESWLSASQVRAERARVGPYTVFWGFTPPAPVVPVSRAGWSVRASAGVGEPERLADGRIDSGWSSAPGPAGAASIEVDLGRPTRLAGVTLLTDDPERMPERLEVTAGDGARPGSPLVARLEPGGLAMAWRNGAPRTTPSQTLTVRFEPIETRRLRLADAGPAGRWVVSEIFLLAPLGQARTPSAGPQIEAGRRLETAGALGAALLRYRAAMAAAPDDPEGYAEFTRLAAAMGIHSGAPAEQAARYARLGLIDEARASYARLATALGPGVAHAELAQQQARLAARAGDAAEAERLAAQARAILTPPRSVRVAFGRVVELTGFDLTPARARPGESVEVGVSWRLIGEPTAPLFAYTHFRGEGGGRFGDDYRLPGPIPGLGTGPQHIRERRRLAIPEGARPGPYRVLVGVWEPEAGRHLRRWWGGILPTPTRTVEVDTLEVLARP